MSKIAIVNSNFETVPTFVAATTANQVWIDGSASGSAVNKDYGWANTIKGGSIASFFDSAEMNSGAYSMKLSTTATASFIEVHKSQIDSNASRLASPFMVVVLPNKTYTWSGWMKTNYVSGDSAHGAFMNMGTFNSTGALVGGSNTTAKKTTTGWTRYNSSFTTGSTEVLAEPKLIVYGQTGAGTLIMDAWFDDLEIYGPGLRHPNSGIRPHLFSPGLAR